MNKLITYAIICFTIIWSMGYVNFDDDTTDFILISFIVILVYITISDLIEKKLKKNNSTSLEQLIVGTTKIGVSKDLKLLNQLTGIEEPIIIICVSYNDKWGVLAALKNKLIYATKGLISNDIFEISYSKVSSANIQSGIIQSKITITGSGFDYEFKEIDKEGAKVFIAKLNALIDESNSPKQTAPKEDVFEKLKKLSELKNQRIISDEEYETQRKKFLSEM